MKQTITCIECGKKFTASRNDAETCSDLCRGRKKARLDRAKATETQLAETSQNGNAVVPATPSPPAATAPPVTPPPPPDAPRVALIRAAYNSKREECSRLDSDIAKLQRSQELGRILKGVLGAILGLGAGALLVIFWKIAIQPPEKVYDPQQGKVVFHRWAAEVKPWIIVLAFVLVVVGYILGYRWQWQHHQEDKAAQRRIDELEVIKQRLEGEQDSLMVQLNAAEAEALQDRLVAQMQAEQERQAERQKPTESNKPEDLAVPADQLGVQSEPLPQGIIQLISALTPQPNPVEEGTKVAVA